MPVRSLINDDIPAALAAAALFQGMLPEDVQSLATMMVNRRYARGDIIMNQGDLPGAVHLVCSGEVKITIANEEGKETLLALLRPGDLFGEIAALDGRSRSATVTAVEATGTAALARQDLLAFVRTHPDFALKLIETLAARLRRIDERLEDAHFLDLDTRFARTLIDLAEQRGAQTSEGVSVGFPLTQSELASMIGATRVSVNRLLGAYQDTGLIRLEKRKMVILDVARLRGRAGR